MLRPCHKSRASRGGTACSSRCSAGSTPISVRRGGRGRRRSGCGRRTRSLSSARRGDWRSVGVLALVWGSGFACELKEGAFGCRCTLFNPTPEQFLEAQRVVQPNFLYIQGQQLEDEKEIGSLVWGDVDVSDVQAFSCLISPPFPTIVRI